MNRHLAGQKAFRQNIAKSSPKPNLHTVNQHQFPFQNDLQEYSQFGLPNATGSLCYLISILQGLYSMKKFRQYLIKVSEHDEEELKKGRQMSNKVYSRMIGSIFGAIQDKADMTTKRYFLKNLSEKLFSENMGFNKYEYNDAVIALQFILDKLRKEDPNMSCFFEIRSRKWCNCGEISKKMIHRQSVLMLTQECENCDKEVQQEVIDYPQHLICVPAQETKYYESTLRKITEKQKHLVYRQTAFIQYRGDRKVGHYTTVRKSEQDKNIWLQLSDSSVRSTNPKYFQYSNRRLCFFELEEN